MENLMPCNVIFLRKSQNKHAIIIMESSIHFIQRKYAIRQRQHVLKIGELIIMPNLQNFIRSAISDIPISSTPM